MQQEAVQFTELENTKIGRNISMYRMIRQMKADDVAEQLKMSPSTYTKYERGETAITIPFLNKVANVLKVDPMWLIAYPPSNIIENSHHFALHGYFNNQPVNDQQLQSLTKITENLIVVIQHMSEQMKNFIDSVGKKD